MVNNSLASTAFLMLVMLLRDEGYLVVVLVQDAVEPFDLRDEPLSVIVKVGLSRILLFSLVALGALLLYIFVTLCRSGGLLLLLKKQCCDILAQAEQRHVEVLRHSARVHFNRVLTGDVLGKGTLDGYATVLASRVIQQVLPQTIRFVDVDGARQALLVMIATRAGLLMGSKFRITVFCGGSGDVEDFEV